MQKYPRLVNNMFFISFFLFVTYLHLLTSVFAISQSTFYYPIFFKKWVIFVDVVYYLISVLNIRVVILPILEVRFVMGNFTCIEKSDHKFFHILE